MSGRGPAHDLAQQLSRYRSTSLLARETNGDLALALQRRRTRAAGAVTDADSTLMDDLAPWLAAEYTAAHGEKRPRPPRALSIPPGPILYPVRARTASRCRRAGLQGRL